MLAMAWHPFGINCQLYINTLRPWQNGRHFADDLFKCNFLNENVWILIRFSLKSVPKVPNYIPALVQIMAWYRPGTKPLSESMVARLLTHICVTQPQRVNVTWLSWHLKSQATWLFCSTAYTLQHQTCPSQHQRNIKALHSLQWVMDSPHKGTLIWKVVPRHHTVSSGWVMALCNHFLSHNRNSHTNILPCW